MKKIKNLVALVALISLVGCNGGSASSNISSSSPSSNNPETSSNIPSSEVPSSETPSSEVPGIEFNEFYTIMGKTSQVEGSVKKDESGYSFKFVTDFPTLSEEDVVELYISVGTSFAREADDVVIAVDGTGSVAVSNFIDGVRTEMTTDGVTAEWSVVAEKNVLVIEVAYEALGTEPEDVIGVAFKVGEAQASLTVDKAAGDTPAVEATHPDYARIRTFTVNVDLLNTYFRVDTVGNVFFSYANDGSRDYTMLSDRHYTYDAFESYKDEDGLTFVFITNFSTSDGAVEYINLLVDVDGVKTGGWTIGATDLDFRIYSDGDIYYISGADTADAITNKSNIWWYNPDKNILPYKGTNASIAQKLDTENLDDLSAYEVVDLGGGFKKVTLTLSYDMIYELSEANCDVDLDMFYMLTQGREMSEFDTNNYNSWLYGSIFADGKWIGQLQDTASQSDYTVILEK